MKKKFILIAALSLLLALPGCGPAEKQADGEKTANQTAEENKEKEPDEKAEEKEPEKVYDATAAAEKYGAHEAIELWSSKEEMPYGNEEIRGKIPNITPYIAEGNTKGGCVIICPGGGYISLSKEKEGTAPAEAFNKNNITAFVLQYRIRPYDGKAFLADINRAVRYVRYHAEDFAIDPDKIAVMGFSAGGHLAAMSLEHYGEDTQALDEIDQVSSRPNYGILCYPVISLKGEKTHGVTEQTFLGEDAENEELILKYSGEEGVSKDMPPVFIWHCKNDEGVPVSNSEDFAKAMEDVGASVELHIYEDGAHGIGLAEDYAEAGTWFPSCIKWLQDKNF